MPRKSKWGFVWEEAQCFFGVEDTIVTSYTNDQLTLSIVQDNTGKLLGLTYETDETSGDIIFEEKSVSKTTEHD